ncbi:MAG: AAA family ATPase, partial [Myxococcota bacterium]|nr:AAA family ATPase [Myxococcota bacterium]
RRITDRFGGYLDRFEDDVLVVLFGLPKADEHDLERALTCARELLRLPRRLRRHGLFVDLGVGIHRGTVTLGNKKGRRYGVLPRGDTIKLGVHVAQASEPGEILVSDVVAGLVGRRYQLEPGPVLRRKIRRRRSQSQKELRAPTYRLVRERWGMESPSHRWIVRSSEVEVLSSAVAGLSEGTGSVVLLRGSAGTGKTRLLRELRELAGQRGVPLYWGRTRPVGGARNLSVFRQIVASIGGFDPDDEPAILSESLSRLAQLRLEPAEIDILGTLFGIKPAERPSTPLNLETYGRVATRLLRGVADVRPTMLAFEDLQFMDATGIELLGRVVQAARELPVLLLLTSREVMPGELGEPDLEVVLGPLNRVAMEKMVAEWADVTEVSRGLLDLVERTTEGNPLYAEAMLEALSDSKRLRIQEATVDLLEPAVDPQLPPGLEALIAARIDALDPASKGALQVAATLGHSFAPTLLAEVAGLDDAGPLISDLVSHGLVYREKSTHESRCAFASDLVWELVHRSILGVQRRDYHRMVVAGMSTLYKDNLEPHREELALHLAKGGRWSQAIEHATRAGDSLRRQEMLDPAVRCWEKALDWVQDWRSETGGSATGNEEELSLRLRVGESWFLLGDAVKAERHLVVCMDLAEDLGRLEVQVESRVLLGRLFLARGRHGLARDHLEEARQLAESVPTQNHQLVVAALVALGSLLHDTGKTAEGEELFQEALVAAGEQDGLKATAYLGLASRFLREGGAAESLVLLERALECARVADDRILVG